MRLLVACKHCRRQYDASDWQPGTRFHCHCGQQLEVQLPRAHDAAAVRCSSCGAPRSKGLEACSHCGSDFTIHEKDLNTVCPACLARVSDQARFCHCSGSPLTAEEAAGALSPYLCPTCQSGRLLVSRRLGRSQFAVLECPGCAGLWIDLKTLDLVLNSESPQGQALASTPAVIETPLRQSYRPCAVCGALMPRRNFGLGESGVIVDVCGFHGLWFDADEFARLLAWVRAGGREAALQDLASLVGSSGLLRKSRPRHAERATTQPAPDDSEVHENRFLLACRAIYEAVRDML